MEDLMMRLMALTNVVIQAYHDDERDIILDEVDRQLINFCIKVVEANLSDEHRQELITILETAKSNNGSCQLPENRSKEILYALGYGTGYLVKLEKENESEGSEGDAHPD